MKAFMLFLFYSCLMLLLSAGIALFASLKAQSIEILFAVMIVIMGLLFSVFLGAFAWNYVPEVCLRNRTTIERIAGNAPETWNAGTRSNIEQVFGEKWYLWFVPIPPTFSGFAWSASQVTENLIAREAVEEGRAME
jgi:hypothetical protein